MLGKIEGRRRGCQEDEMVGWHHQLGGHEFDQAPGVADKQGSLACCSPWDRKELDMTEQLNNTSHIKNYFIAILKNFCSIYNRNHVYKEIH